MELTHYIGVDISKNTLDFAVCKQGEIILQLQEENNKKGISKVVKQLRNLPGFAMTQSVFCMEHTGIYNYHLQEYLQACKSHVWLETALRIKQSQGMLRGKNDQVDAVRIAEYAYTFREKIRLWKPVGDTIKQLKLLITMRERLVNGITQLTTPLEENRNFMDKDLAKMERKAFKNTISAMKKDLKQVEKSIDEIIDQDPDLKKLFRLVTSVDGVGTITAINIIAVTNQFNDFNDAKKFACYSGVVPFKHTSGSSIRGRERVSHLANKKIKTLLHLAAMSTIRMKGELQEYYKRKIAEGKNKMSVINAIRNKILYRIFAVVKRGSPYQKDYTFSLV